MGVYALALVPVWFLELFVLNRFPLFGVAPMLLPLAAVCVAVLEGTTAGAGFGLFVGILCDAAYFNTDGAMTVGLCLIGVGAGRPGPVCAAPEPGGLPAVLLRGAGAHRRGAHRRPPAGRAGELAAMLGLAGREILWSLVFVFPVYALFLWVFRRVPKKTVL